MLFKEEANAETNIQKNKRTKKQVTKILINLFQLKDADHLYIRYMYEYIIVIIIQGNYM